MSGTMESEDEIAEIMSSSPVADNHGSGLPIVATSDGLTNAHTVDGELTQFTSPKLPRQGLNSSDHEAMQATQSVVSDPKEFYYMGMTAHRGVLHPDEYVDMELLWSLVEEELGVALDEISALFAVGNPSPERLAAKSAIEDKFLEIEQSGGDVYLLASLIGWRVDTVGRTRCRPMRKALARARQRQEEDELAAQKQEFDEWDYRNALVQDE